MEMDEIAGDLMQIVQALCLAVLLAGGFFALARGAYFNPRRDTQGTAPAQSADEQTLAGRKVHKRYSHAGAELE